MLSPSPIWEGRGRMVLKRMWNVLVVLRGHPSLEQLLTDWRRIKGQLNCGVYVYMCVCVWLCVCKFRVNWKHVSWIRPMNWWHEYQKAMSPFYKLQDLGLFMHDLCRYKVWPGVRVGQKVPPCVWASVTWMSTGYMCHKYDLHTGNWMMILISTSNITG